ncbi:hypothetical protein [Aquisalibacillus elongatus]|uniref:hypothetical protein n=1 Tax=Aquisalibacillus elongatus TaxID=485577 RepID=UPI000F5259F4|nr:hypothetical protein [Aquisalibacillus elongatus]
MYKFENNDPPSEEYEDLNLTLIHVFEENDQATATYGWYYIDLDNWDIYEYELATNQLTHIYKYQDGEYIKNQNK